MCSSPVREPLTHLGDPRTLKSFIAKVVSPAGLRAVAACLCMEALVLALLFALTGSFGISISISIVALGPLSLFFALPIYRHFSQSR